MDFRHVLYEKRADGVAVLTLNRPERLNALHAGVLAEVDAALDDVENGGEVRCLLLRGAPRPDGRPCFCAGFDLKSVAEGVPADPGIGLRVARRLDDALVPSIAVVDGVCSTGGAELAVACDLRLVGDAARIGDWHLKNLGTGLGGWGAATRWQRLVGTQKTKELFLTGREIGAEEAVRIGWAAARFPSEELPEAALAMAGEIAGRNPRGVRMVLAHLNRADDMTRDESIRWALELPGIMGVETAMEGKAEGVLSRAERKE